MATKKSAVHCLLVGIAAAASVLTSTSTAPAGTVLQVTNKDLKDTVVLSDLIAMGADGARKVILEPNNPKDDITMDPGQIKIFDAGFEVTSYIISRQDGKNEFETTVFNVQQVKATKIGFLEDPSTGLPLVASIDYNTGAPPLPDGSTVTLTDGTSTLLPGWFVGTSIDFDTGVVSGPFSGTAEFLTGFTVAAVPEPSSLMLAGAAALVGLGVWVRLRRG
jgi:hypothetical protein